MVPVLNGACSKWCLIEMVNHKGERSFIPWPSSFYMTEQKMTNLEQERAVAICTALNSSPEIMDLLKRTAPEHKELPKDV